VEKISLNILKSYRELLLNGYFKTIVEGQNVRAEIRFFISGDYLNFITPKNGKITSQAELFELIRADGLLKQNMLASLETLQQKLRGITILPKIFSAFFSVISAGLIYRTELLKLIGAIDSAGYGSQAKSVFLVLLMYIFFRFRYKITGFFVRVISKCINLKEIIRRHLLHIQPGQ